MILRFGQEGDTVLSLPNGFLFSTEIRQGETEKGVALRIRTLGRSPKLLFEARPRLLGATACGRTLIATSR